MGSVCLKGGGSGISQRTDEPEPSGNAASLEPVVPQEVQQTPVKAPAREELQHQAVPVAVGNDLSGPSKESSNGQRHPDTIVSGGGDDIGPAKNLPQTSTSLPHLVAESCSDVPLGGKPGATASSASTAEGPPVGYDSEGNFSSGAFASECKEEPVKRAMSDAVDIVPPKSTPSLDEQTALKLRKYAKRNRPDRDKFKSQPTNAASIVSAATAVTSGKPEADKGIENQEHPRPCLDQKMIKYDIFDDVDADRLKEFDDLFIKVKQNSNYEAHKRKSVKNKAKFSTAAVVDTDEETGQTSIT